MNYQELLSLESNSPIRLSDGKFGIIIRTGEDEAGVQVPGEEDIRWLALPTIGIVGDGALVELTSNE
jgi:hypothetical protein